MVKPSEQAMKTIIDLLTKLNKQQLKQVKSRIGAMISLGANGDGSDPLQNETWVLTCIVEFLRNMGAEYVSVEQLRSTTVMDNLRDKLDGLQTYLAQASNKIVVQRAILSIGLELLYADLMRKNEPISARVIMSHIHRIPAVINHAFPAYAQSGLLSYVVDIRNGM